MDTEQLGCPRLNTTTVFQRFLDQPSLELTNRLGQGFVVRTQRHAWIPGSQAFQDLVMEMFHQDLFAIGLYHSMLNTGFELKISSWRCSTRISSPSAFTTAC